MKEGNYNCRERYLGGIPRQKLLAVLFAIMFLPLTVWAERYIILNGQRLSDGEIELLERVHGGTIANGNYWLDPRSGLWG
jgi:hypothetical protein